MRRDNFKVALDADGRAVSAMPTLPKHGIYTISYRRRVIRLGESGSGRDRIWKGFREPLRKKTKGKERKNYMAYHWRSRYANRTLQIYYFAPDDEFIKETYARRALEAELTFQFRIATGEWPRDMSEIHFLESYRREKRLVAIAIEILDHHGVSYNRHL